MEKQGKWKENLPKPENKKNPKKKQTTKIPKKIRALIEITNDSTRLPNTLIYEFDV